MAMPEKAAARAIGGKAHKFGRKRSDFVRVLTKKMAIVTLSDVLLSKRAAKPGTVLRDKVLCGLCLRVGSRTQTFCIATTVRGQPVRLTLGRWPLITVAQARELALPILRQCRAGDFVKPARIQLPTLRQTLDEYGAARKVKASSLQRYRSLLTTHFAEWLDKPVSALSGAAFRQHCHEFVQTRGAALVDLGRGVIGSLLKYLGAVHNIDIQSPFARLGAAGLMPARPAARARKLAETRLPEWTKGVDTLPESQRDYLRLLMLSGLRRNEGLGIRRHDVDFDKGELTIPDTKNGKPHTLPITKAIREILARRCDGLEPGGLLFAGVSGEHVAEMAERAGAPTFTLHDLRKQLASVGARIGIGDAILRRILGHMPKTSDVLHRHYVSLTSSDIRLELERIQQELLTKCGGS
ncbi:integrase family protein [Burkholderia cepacia]|uniref:tyrosine-type recombinase/integrase n=1 Tax=Burkholderia cepacia TaxID=292 RepID=UPI0018693279|nr:integrase family protein [Burkholderia cepacia]MBE2967654.1 integrase family protein [Burkholderia cepacia]